jgi:hypothetical protein
MTHVGLTTGGRYLRVSSRDGEQRLTGDGAALEVAGVFDRVELPHGRVALRTRDGSFLTRRPDRGQNFGLYLEAELTPAAVFEEILWPSGEVSLRSTDLTYVCVPENSPAVTVNRVEPGAGSRFSYVPAPVPGVPAQRRAGSGERRTAAAASFGPAARR